MTDTQAPTSSLAHMPFVVLVASKDYVFSFSTCIVHNPTAQLPVTILNECGVDLVSREHVSTHGG